MELLFHCLVCFRDVCRHKFKFVSTVFYCTVLHCTIFYCTVLYCTVLHCTVLYFTVLFCTVLYYAVLYCTALYCTVLLPPGVNPIAFNKIYHIISKQMVLETSVHPPSNNMTWLLVQETFIKTIQCKFSVEVFIFP